MKKYDLNEYLNLVNVNAKGIENWEDLSDALSYYTDGNLWAYPLDELSHCIENDINVCLVTMENGNKALAELPYIYK